MVGAEVDLIGLRPLVSAFTNDTTLFISVADRNGRPGQTPHTGLVSSAVRSHHQQVDGCSRMSTTSRGLSGYAVIQPIYHHILASVEGSTVNGLRCSALPAFCRSGPPTERLPIAQTNEISIDLQCDLLS